MAINKSWITSSILLVSVLSLFNCKPNHSVNEERISQTNNSVTINAGPRGYEQGRVFFKLVSFKDLAINPIMQDSLISPSTRTVTIAPTDNINSVMAAELIFPVRNNNTQLFSNFTARDLPMKLSFNTQGDVSLGARTLSTNQDFGGRYLRFGDVWSVATTNFFNGNANWPIGDEFYVVFYLVSTKTYFNTDIDPTIPAANKQKIIELQINVLNTQNDNLLALNKHTIRF
ncbi:hypothetical protein PVA45_02570 [Entomospira entomophila]|uniref:Uncharacterized protein n=1 Tax=Entomospira entomophila TaxID=2719988 RepID=A0A968KSJ0_9SPIO|nr:hypothetical protein [Entomospira entomophilus]NIZ40397.1 hypothetical protein [Entomospira entomophilus]WDI35956.1 hypothetical protein PVA45_02570 [Entomospira entomophilus]